MNNLDDLLNEYEAEWQMPFPPNLEKFLEKHHVDQSAAVWELVRIDMDRRIRRFRPSATLPSTRPFQIESYRTALLHRGLLVNEAKTTPRTVFLDVIATELKARMAIGESVTISEYESRFPKLLEGEIQTLRSSFQDSLIAPWRSNRQTPKDLSFLQELQVDPTQFLQALADQQLLTSEEFEARVLNLQKVNTSREIADSLAEQRRLFPYQAFAALFAPDAPIRIEKYPVLQYLTAGGMGDIYLAYDDFLCRKVVIKLLPADSNSTNSQKRFKREIEVLARLKHENIVAAYAGGMFENSSYLVMEYVEGLDLGTDVRTYGPLSPRDAVASIRDAARALQYAHKQGIIHRDIKPSNLIRCEEQGRLRVLDLGIAKLVDDTSSALTVHGAAIGTPIYMAPEQASGGPIDERCDIYALGSTLYYLATGRYPFSGTARAILSQVVLGIGDNHFKDLQGGLENVIPLIRGLMKVDPNDRPKTMADVATWCDQVLVELDQPSTEVEHPRNRFWPVIWLSAGAGALAAAGILSVWVQCLNAKQHIARTFERVKTMPVCRLSRQLFVLQFSHVSTIALLNFAPKGVVADRCLILPSPCRTLLVTCPLQPRPFGKLVFC